MYFASAEAASIRTCAARHEQSPRFKRGALPTRPRFHAAVVPAKGRLRDASPGARHPTGFSDACERQVSPPASGLRSRSRASNPLPRAYEAHARPHVLDRHSPTSSLTRRVGSNSDRINRSRGSLSASCVMKQTKYPIATSGPVDLAGFEPATSTLPESCAPTAPEAQVCAISRARKVGLRITASTYPTRWT